MRYTNLLFTYLLTYLLTWRCFKNFQEDRQTMRSVLMKLYRVFEAKLLVYYQQYKFVSRVYENTGHFASWEGISRDTGHMGRNTGCHVPGNTGLLATTNYLWVTSSELQQCSKSFTLLASHFLGLDLQVARLHSSPQVALLIDNKHWKRGQLAASMHVC